MLNVVGYWDKEQIIYVLGYLPTDCLLVVKAKQVTILWRNWQHSDQMLKVNITNEEQIYTLGDVRYET